MLKDENAVMLKDENRNYRWSVQLRARSLLEGLYELDPYPRLDAREHLAQQLNVTQRQVQIWFQNRRQRDQRQQKTGTVPGTGRRALPLDNATTLARVGASAVTAVPMTVLANPLTSGGARSPPQPDDRGGWYQPTVALGYTPAHARAVAAHPYAREGRTVQPSTAYGVLTQQQFAYGLAQGRTAHQQPPWGCAPPMHHYLPPAYGSEAHTAHYANHQPNYNGEPLSLAHVPPPAPAQQWCSGEAHNGPPYSEEPPLPFGEDAHAVYPTYEHAPVYDGGASAPQLPRQAHKCGNVAYAQTHAQRVTMAPQPHMQQYAANQYGGLASELPPRGARENYVPPTYACQAAHHSPPVDSVTAIPTFPF